MSGFLFLIFSLPINIIFFLGDYMYSDKLICSDCFLCIFYYYDHVDSKSFCRASFPFIQLCSTSFADFLLMRSSNFTSMCPRYINIFDHLSLLRSQFDGGNK